MPQEKDFNFWFRDLSLHIDQGHLHSAVSLFVEGLLVWRIAMLDETWTSVLVIIIIIIRIIIFVVMIVIRIFIIIVIRIIPRPVLQVSTSLLDSFPGSPPQWRPPLSGRWSARQAWWSIWWGSDASSTLPKLQHQHYQHHQHQHQQHQQQHQHQHCWSNSLFSHRHDLWWLVLGWCGGLQFHSHHHQHHHHYRCRCHDQSHLDGWFEGVVVHFSFTLSFPLMDPGPSTDNPSGPSDLKHY